MLVEFWIRDLYQFVGFEHFMVWNLLWKKTQQLEICNGLYVVQYRRISTYIAHNPNIIYLSV